jgi:para-nitrobenzyl esterase
MKRLVMVAFGCVLFAAGTAAAANFDPVKIDTGMVSGVDGSSVASVRAYKGLPFAAPPVGENRWRAPQPAAKWDGVRKADAFGAPCTSGPAPAGRGGGRGGRGAAPAPGAAPVARPAPREPQRSEDCLYLNVWTSAARATDKRPVMVWIYGGGFTGGSGGLAWYDGENLASKGPVIVTLNYRLGALGFMAHPDLAKESGHPGSGNYGMMDAIAALQWVKRNIAAFGGDPNNVTVAGESAGAIMVGALVGSPQAKGLFHRAIAESGGWMGLTMGRMRSSADAEAAAVKAVEAMGATSIAELRARPLEQLTGLPGGASLLIDGYLIPEDLSITFRNGKQNAVDVLTGSNQDEANFGVCPGAGLNGRGGAARTTVDAFKASAQRKYGDQADQFVRLYGVASDADAARAAHQACADEINWNMRQWAAAQAKLGKKAYTYFFTHTPTVNGAPSPQGATHTAEISYAWNNPKGQATQTWNDVDTKLADMMSSYWVNFITKGDPNGSGLPPWPQFKDLSKSKVMVLGDTPTAETAVPAPKLAVFDAAYARMMTSAGTN